VRSRNWPATLWNWSCGGTGAMANAAAFIGSTVTHGMSQGSLSPNFGATGTIGHSIGGSLGGVAQHLAQSQGAQASEFSRVQVAAVVAGVALGTAVGLRTRRKGVNSFRPRSITPLTKVAAAAQSAVGDIQKRFFKERSLTYLCMFIGYATFYLTRLSFPFVAPIMREEMGYTMMQLGAISSFFPLAYMNAKFISGVLSDLLGSPKSIFAGGLLLCGLANMGFAMGTTVPWFTAFWVANGLFQGCGASPCGKMLVNWFPTASRGTWWSVWNSSSNIGGFIIPLLAGSIASSYGWRMGMLVPGAIAVVMSIFCMATMSDSPEKLGLPSAEGMARSLAEDGSASDSAQEGASNEAEDPNEGGSLVSLLLGNRFLWTMSAMHFFVYFMRQGVMNWAAFYMMDQYNLPAMQAMQRITGFEAGGLVGCISAGKLSDWLISRNPEGGSCGMRARVMFGYSLCTMVGIAGLWLLPPVFIYQWLAMAAFGFSIYGPQTLITMTGVESMPRRAAATAGGFLAYSAQFGAMAAGLPFAMIVKRFGWQGYFPCLMLLSLLSAAAVLPGWNAPSWAQRKQKSMASA